MKKAGAEGDSATYLERRAEYGRSPSFYLDCEVTRHIELESDHRVYVGQVQVAAELQPYNPNGGPRRNGEAWMWRSETEAQ